MSPTAVELADADASRTTPQGQRLPVPVSCPACGSRVASDQSWCLECGAAARTRIAKLPRWRAATVAVGIAVALAFGGIIYAFVKLSSGSGTVATTPTITQTVPAAATPTTPAPAAPATTQPATPNASTPPVPTTTPGR